MKQSYHDITSRNNAYFNAYENLKLVKRNILETHSDDYDDVLTLYPQHDPEIAKTYSNDLDEVIKKASTAIRLHGKSPDGKGSKKDDGIESRWSENCYLLVGESYYLKGDYDQAIEALQYLSTEYKEKDRLKSENPSKSQKAKSVKKKKKQRAKAAKKRKKARKKKKKQRAKGKSTSTKEIAKVEEEEKEGPNESFLHNLFTHLPRRPDALIWLINTYTAQKKYKEAETVVTLIDADEYFPDERLFEEYLVAIANIYIQKGELEKALNPLIELNSSIKNKRKKIRYTYVLAQIYERLKRYPEAVDNYRVVLKSKPVFDMAFNAKMSIARISALDESIDYKEVKKLLIKLLKDDKNIDFFDQIYYAIAELELNHNNKVEGVSNLKMSVATSTTNDNQKAKSYLKLAQLYYADEAYVTSQAYYDSTLSVLAIDNTNYLDVSRRNEVLKDLVDNINIVALQDSLQMIALLPDNRREIFINEIIRQKEKQLINEKLNKEQAKLAKSQTDVLNSSSNNSSTGWYFYNVAAKAQGYNEFIRNWGQRKLEDNWRLSDKNTFDNLDEEVTVVEEITLDDPEFYEKEREKIEKQLPLDDKKIAVSHNLIMDALYNQASIYKNYLNNKQKAIYAYEELLKRYPDNKYLVETYYDLYLLYADQGNGEKSNFYKNKVLDEFPNSTFAKIILDPKFLEKSKKTNKQIADYYKQTYNLFLNDTIDINLVISRIEAADSLFKENYLKPKFALLEAYTIGKTKNIDNYIAALQNVSSSYPTDEVSAKAEEILDYLKANEDPIYKFKINAQKYDFDKQSTHFFMISWNDPIIEIENMKLRLGNYNDVNRSLDELKIQALNIIDNENVVLVKEFKNMKIAVSYFNNILENDKVFDGLDKESLEFFVISDTNFNMIIKNREFNSYKLFFQSKYITNIN